MDTLTLKARNELQRDQDIRIAVALDQIDPVEYFADRDVVTMDQAKFRKTANETYFQVGLTLSPWRESGDWNLCPFASAGCRASCLNTTYRLAYSPNVRTRVLRTKLLMTNRAKFLEYVARDLAAVRKKVHRAGRILVVRWNTLSDINAETVYKPIWSENDVYVDYTKNAARYQSWLEGKLPSNYHLTFSRSETNQARAELFVAQGGTATVVVRSEAFRAEMLAHGWNGFPCVDGDISDRRWEDPKGHWVVLVAKGKAKSDRSGFVI